MFARTVVGKCVRRIFKLAEGSNNSRPIHVLLCNYTRPGREIIDQWFPYLRKLKHLKLNILGYASNKSHMINVNYRVTLCVRATDGENLGFIGSLTHS